MTAPNAPMSAEEVLAVMGLVNAASPGPWEPDDMESDGVYGDSGPDGHAGFMAQRMRDANGVSMFDSLNSEGAIVDEDIGEESVYAWDVVAEKNFRAIAAAVNFVRQHGAAVAAMAEREAALIVERDGFKSAWWDVVEMLGGKKLTDISNAQYHASVLVPKIRELIALTAERDALVKEVEAQAKRIAEREEDFRRIEWLALNPRGASTIIDGKARPCVFWGVSSAPENTLRQAIDAARAESS